MSQTKQVVAFEVDKIKNNKFLISIVAVLIAAVLIIPVISYFCLTKTELSFEENRQAVLINYQKELEQAESILIDYADKLNKQEKEEYIQLCNKLRFFINSGTIASDYLNSDSLTTKYEARENAGFMFYFGAISHFFLWALAIAAAAYLFVFEYHTNTMKNILASRINRGKIFKAKLLLLLAFLTAVFFVLTLFGLIFGMTQSGVNLYVLHNGNYCAISSIFVFLTQAVANYVTMLALSAVTILIGIRLKNIPISIAAPSLLYGLTLLMHIGISDAVSSNPAYNKINHLDKIPILSLEFHIGGFDWNFVISLVLHLLFANILIYYGYRIFRKQDL